MTPENKVLLGLAGVAAAAAGIFLATDASASEGGAGADGDISPGDPGYVPSRTDSPYRIVADVGKHWVITNKLLKAGTKVWNGKAANYGWHTRTKVFDGVSCEASVSLPGVYVIQGVGTVHDAAHADYSQNCVLVAKDCYVDGTPRRLDDLLVDPAFAPYLSSEGPLVLLRQPGPAILEPGTATTSQRVTRAEVEALPNSVPDRDAMLLAWVEAGMGEYGFAPMEVGGGITVSVFTDALRFGGVRVCMTADTQQKIADRLDCMLLTPKLADLIFASATTELKPIPLGSGYDMAYTSRMIKESDKVDQAIAARA